ncbi:dTDP-4-dehydrorhamnose 3,5-epimerase, partial [Serratia marcescens]
MQVIDTKIDGVKVIQPTVFSDTRGFFMETFEKRRFQDMLDIDLDFVQDNYSRSSRGVLRGLHYQDIKPQGKLVRVVRGEVYDVAVDIRPDSPTFGKWEGIVLSEENKTQLWIPPGLAHGFVVLSEIADFEYKCTDYYSPEHERCLMWNDPDV